MPGECIYLLGFMLPSLFLLYFNLLGIWYAVPHEIYMKYKYVLLIQAQN